MNRQRHWYRCVKDYLALLHYVLRCSTDDLVYLWDLFATSNHGFAYAVSSSQKTLETFEPTIWVVINKVLI